MQMKRHRYYNRKYNWFKFRVFLLLDQLLEMDSLTEKPNFFGFIFIPWNHIEIFYKTQIILFSVITTDWLYPKKKHCRKRLSDFNKIKFYQHLYHCKRKRLNQNMIKTFNWLVLGNKCEICLQKKWRKKKTQHLEIFSYHRKFSNRKTETWCVKSNCFCLKKTNFLW